MAQSVFTHLEDETTMKTVKGASLGLAIGSAIGAVVANLYDVPTIEKNVKLTGMMRTVKTSGSYGLALAAFGGLYVGVEQFLSKKRMKDDVVNGAVAASLAGASVFGLKGRSISTAISSGCSLALASVLLDTIGETPKPDAANLEKKPTTH